MRSPWLSREYEKSKNVVVEKRNNEYVLRNTTNNAEINLSEKEYEKYDKNLFNEIEWEKLFLMGLAADKNCDDFEIDPNFDLMKKNFIKSSKVEAFSLKVENEMFKILINPEYGSWMALTEEEYEKYENGGLSKSEWLSLFIRGLAEE